MSSRSLLLLALVAATPAHSQPALRSGAQSTPASASVTPEARAILEGDWVLMNWALKYHDINHDIMLEPDELRAAAAEFRGIADANSDGRVTEDEYRAARTLILMRY